MLLTGRRQWETVGTVTEPLRQWKTIEGLKVVT